MATSWATIIIFALIATPGALRSVALLWMPTGGSEPSLGTAKRLPPRPDTIRAGTFLAWQLLLTFTLFSTYTEGGWSWERVGMRSEISPLFSFEVGIAAYFLLTISFRLVLRLLGNEQSHAARSFLTFRRFWPRSRVGKVFSIVACCVFNPITEELVYPAPRNPQTLTSAFLFLRK